MNNITGIILAGGDSRRMGRDKAFLPIEHKPLIEIVFHRMQEVCREVIIVSNDCLKFEKFSSFFHVEKDIFPHCGPLGGIYTGLKRAKDDIIFVSACDMPFLNKPLAQKLIVEIKGVDAVVPEFNDRLHPLFAVYSKESINVAASQLQKKCYKMMSFLELINVRILKEKNIKPLDKEGRSFININTIKEYKKYKNK